MGYMGNQIVENVFLLLCFTELYGKNNLEAAFIDQITETLRDLVFIAGHSWFSEKDETKKVH